MCYSNSSTSSNETLGKFYQREIVTLPSAEPTYYANGFTFPSWRIITHEPQIKRMQWGLIPSWYSGVSPIDIAIKTLNARIETLSEKASFKRLVSTQRCIVPSSGFFEFQHKGAEKIPYFIYPIETPLLDCLAIASQPFLYVGVLPAAAFGIFSRGPHE
jgi:putative SOS response-associated peptidase YedK